jgi:hypothetical protein
MSKEHGKFLSAVPALTCWLSDKIENHKRKKRAKYGVDAIDNIERLYRLKECGAINEDDFQELKEKLKNQI